MQTPERSVELTPATEWDGEDVRAVEDWLAAREPLGIRIHGIPITIAMRTPGHDLELATGFLMSEGVIELQGQIDSFLAVVPKNGTRSNTVEVQLQDTSFDPRNLQRNLAGGR